MMTDETGTTTEQAERAGGEITSDRQSRSTRVRKLLAGDGGFERAVVWSNVGFALTVGAFLAVDSATAPDVGRAVAVAAVSLAGLGTVGLARGGGGLGGCVVLPVGPVAAAAVEVIRPTAFGTLLGSEPITATLVLVITQSAALGVVIAVVVGVLGYGVGRALGRLGRQQPDSSDADDGHD